VKDYLRAALADGLSIKSACAMCQIGVQTLNDWRKRHPGLEQRVAHARELARQKTLRKKGILEPSRQTLSPSNFQTGQLNYAGQPMKPGDSYGGR
jgi:hypothetical protein